MDKESRHPDSPREDGGFGDPQQLVDFGAAVNRDSRGTIYTLTIVGQVEGHQVLPETAKATKYEHVMPLLASLEQSEEIDGILLLLNTVGGDIEAGLGIAELIAGMRKPTVSLVLGGGHSIGVPLAVAPKVSMIVPSASMTIHPVRMNGTVIAAPQTFNYFERIQERIVSFVAKNSRISKKKFLGLMLKTGEMAADVGSVIYGEEAVALGLIDRIGGLSDALDCLYEQIAQARREKGEEPAKPEGPERKPEKKEGRKTGEKKGWGRRPGRGEAAGGAPGPFPAALPPGAAVPPRLPRDPGRRMASGILFGVHAAKILQLCSRNPTCQGGSVLL